MNLRQIEVFRAIMVTKSVSGAADMLQVSQPAVSQVLRHAEDQLRIVLFDRVKGRLHPTPAAHSLYAEVSELYSGIERVRQISEEFRRSASDSLHIVASPSLSRTLLPRAMANFRKACPSVRLKFQSLGYDNIVTALLSHDADLSVVTGYDARAGLIGHKLLEVGLVCALPHSHPLAANAAISPADLRGQPLISFPNKSFVGRMIETAFIAAGEVRMIAIEVPFPETALSLVGHGVGVAVVDELTALSVNDPNVVIRAFAPSAPAAVAIMRTATHARNGLASAFARALCDAAEDVKAMIHAPAWAIRQPNDPVN
jgi:DNA-binding transcriptional LysR family regulator